RERVPPCAVRLTGGLGIGRQAHPSGLALACVWCPAVRSTARSRTTPSARGRPCVACELSVNVPGRQPQGGRPGPAASIASERRPCRPSRGSLMSSSAGRRGRTRVRRPAAALGALSLSFVGLTALPAAATTDGDVVTLDILGITDFHGALAQAPGIADIVSET